MLLDQLPEGPGLRGARRSLVHHRGGAVGQRAVDDVAVAGDPTHISRTPEDILIPDVEDPLKGEVSPEVVAGSGVHHPLRLAGGTGGVKHEQPVFTGHRFSWADVALPSHQLMPPQVTTFHHLDRLLGALHHQNSAHRRTGTTGESGIHSRFQGDGLVLAESAVCRDHRLDLPVDQPIPQSLGREATEDHGMRGTDASAGEHGDGRFWNHRHVEGHQIALADSHRPQSVRGLAHLSVQFAVSETPDIAGLSLPDQCRLGRGGTLEVSVQTVEGKIGGAALEPAGERGIAPIENGVKGLEPVQLPTRRISPEAVGILLGRLRHRPIGLEAADPRTGSQLRRWVEDSLLLKHAFDGCLGVGHSRRGQRSSPRRLKRSSPHDPAPVSNRRQVPLP